MTRWPGARGAGGGWYRRGGGHGTVHWDVAGYALGVLEPREAARCERHLADCPQCAAELAYLLPAGAALADVDPEDIRDLREVEEARLLGRLVAAVTTDRRRARSRSQLAVAAAVATAATVVLVTVAGQVLVTSGGWPWEEPLVHDDGASPVAAVPSPGGPEQPASSGAGGPGIGGPELGDGELHSAADPDTGVRVDIVLSTVSSGTRLSVAVSGLTGPADCRLTALRAGGGTEVLASWRVAEGEAGTAGHPAPLLLDAATATPRGQLVELRVQRVAVDGAVDLLLAVPL